MKSNQTHSSRSSRFPLLVTGLVLATGLGACSIGDSGTARPMVDATPIPVPDALPPIQYSWTETAPSVAGMRGAMEYIPALDPAPEAIFAVVDQRLEKWDRDGGKWEEHTAPAPGLATTIHHISDTEIYSVAGIGIVKWSGILGGAGKWKDVGNSIENLSVEGDAEIHVISETEIYAVIGTSIRMWNGGDWVLHTEPEPNLALAMHFVGPEEIYAVVGEKIKKWSGILGAGGAWTDVSTDKPGLKASLQVVSETEMYAVAGTMVSKWDGSTWSDLTDNIDSMRPTFYRVSDDQILSMTGVKISTWAPIPQ